MVLRTAIACVCLFAGREAAADRMLAIELDAKAPFAERELADALRVRVGATGEPVRVTVTTTAEFGDAGSRRRDVVVTARGGSRVVELGERTGADAARLVALAAVDLLFDDLSMPPDGPPGLTASRTATRDDRWSVGVVGTAAQWSGTLVGGNLDLVIPRGSWFAALDVGGGTLVAGGLHLTGAVVRPGIGTRLAWLDLRAGATFAPISVDDGAGDRTVLAGLGASARLRIPLPEGIDFVIAGGVDAFATRSEYQIGAMTISTPWIAPWLGAGIEVTP